MFSDHTAILGWLGDAKSGRETNSSNAKESQAYKTETELSEIVQIAEQPEIVQVAEQSTVTDEETRASITDLNRITKSPSSSS